MGQKRGVLIGFVIGICITIILALLAGAQVKSTNKVSFCASCHEMQPFYKTWQMAAHGTSKMGVIKAKCVDCHLPHKSFMGYLIAKARFGLNDYWAHYFKETETLPLTWIAEWEGTKPKAHKGYESGCKECHKNLLAPNIPLKAFKAHRTYELGETDKTCISCHHMVGHGDLLAFMREKVKREKQK